MTQTRLSLSIALFILGFCSQLNADERPAGLDQAIRDPNVAMIVDATILKYNKAGHSEIKLHTIYKPAAKGKKIAPLRVVADGRRGRFMFLMDGDLLYSTYNNRFPIREGKKGALEVGIGFNGRGAAWKPLKDTVKLIPGLKGSK